MYTHNYIYQFNIITYLFGGVKNLAIRTPLLPKVCQYF
ncbi:hypothetical protein RINTHH_6250 [Richelia intracellularis HH01]|uniref:Uncharacterized protein n=1 Tax=Richelia intracellularis HH01 TaxID=1165094 RepID=M1X2G4_9NOST|nr:hypothetical protein RINTHH_6250 [Richelia intracellularis HH01]